MKKNWIYFTLVLLSSATAYTCGQVGNTSHQLKAKEFYQKIQSDTAAIVVDVRTPEEFSLGHIPNAINVDWKDAAFETQIKSIDTLNNVYVYCQSGNRSASAIAKMRTLGFMNLFELEGGFMKWRLAGLPEESNR